MNVVIESARSSRRGGNARLWRLIGWVALGHLVVILLLSPQLYWSDTTSPQAVYQRGEQAMKEGKYAEAMELFRRVMDQQPKPPPIYAQAAEQHRLADRLARQSAGQSAAAAEQKPAPDRPSPPTATQPASRPTSTQPARPFIPPELLRK
jgi:tetratricopeptide (TPR) repeat protein